MGAQRIECLEDAAETIDTSSSWNFLAARRDDDVYSMWVVSKGNVPLIDAAVFDGIADCVSVDCEDRETYSKMHVLRYAGDLVGLEMFVDYVVGDLDGRTEGDEDPIGDFRQRNPLWALALLAGGKQG